MEESNVRVLPLPASCSLSTYCWCKHTISNDAHKVGKIISHIHWWSSSEQGSLCRLCQKKNAEKKLAVTVFSFPPDKGNVGTAAYLNVFGSIFKVLQSLQREGYNVGELPGNGEELIQTVSCQAYDSPSHNGLLGEKPSFHVQICRFCNALCLRLRFLQVLNQTEARYNSADMNIAYRMNVDEYQRLCPFSEALEENWGKPPGMQLVQGLSSSHSAILISVNEAKSE